MAATDTAVDGAPAPPLDGDTRANGDGRRSTTFLGSLVQPAPTPQSPGSPWAVLGLVALFAVPLVVALVALARPRWFPLLDLAQTEMRIRDVGTGHPPLIGLPGRIGTITEQGSHPGPISFWAMWPFYELFGRTSWAMQAAAVSLHLLAMGTILWIARRRGGLALVLAMAATLAVLVRFYGPSTLTEAWNPYLPLLWWMVFALAIWSILCGDRPLLPVAVFAGTFCTQTHISYLGLVIGLSGFAVAAGVLGRLVRPKVPDRPRSGPPWEIIAAALLILLWIPPVYDELTRSPGNLTIIWRHFTHPPETPIGLSRGINLLLVHLNPWYLLIKRDRTSGSGVPGLVLLVAWLVTVGVAWRLRHQALLRLHAVLTAALVLGVLSLSRIFGYVWYYLALWAWGINALLLLAVGWTVAVLASSRADLTSRTAKRVRNGALIGIAVASIVAFSVSASHVDVPSPRVSHTLGVVSAQTVKALDSRTAPGGGRAGRYSISWADPVNIGAQAYGLLLEMERQGFRVGFPRISKVIVTPHRVIDPQDATARMHIATGADIDMWSRKPGAVRVAYFDPRSRAERAEFQRLRTAVVDELRASGHAELIPSVDGSLFVSTYDPRMPEDAKVKLRRMQILGLPTAVFIAPPGTG